MVWLAPTCEPLPSLDLDIDINFKESIIEIGNDFYA